MGIPIHILFSILIVFQIEKILEIIQSSNDQIFEIV